MIVVDSTGPRSWRDAFDRSNLSVVESGAREQLLRDAMPRRLEPGRLVHPAGDSKQHVHLVLSGLIRMFVTADDGRSVTVRYCRTGSLIGIASLFASSWRLPLSIEAVTASELLDLRPGTVARMAETDSGVGRALLAETSERVRSFIEEIPRASFSTVSQRVARHVLDLAAIDPGGGLVANTTQEELADAVGTVREVAARALRGLRDVGLVRTERSRIIVVDPDGLVDASVGLG